MYEVTIKQTRTITLKLEASSTDNALIIAATEYRDNRDAALADDADWDEVEVEVQLSCKPINEPCKGVHADEYD